MGLINSAEPKGTGQSWISFLVTVRHTHASPSEDVKTFEMSFLVDDCNEPEIMRKNVNVIRWWHGNGNFELDK